MYQYLGEDNLIYLTVIKDLQQSNYTGPRTPELDVARFILDHVGRAAGAIIRSSAHNLFRVEKKPKPVKTKPGDFYNDLLDTVKLDREDQLSAQYLLRHIHDDGEFRNSKLENTSKWLVENMVQGQITEPHSVESDFIHHLFSYDERARKKGRRV